MQALIYVVNFLLVINAIGLIVAVLMQEGTSAGLGAISGGAETFFGKNKGKSMEGKLEKFTKYGVASFVVLAIIMTVMTARLNTSSSASVADTPAAVTETVAPEETPVATEAPAEADTPAEATPAE